MLHEMFLWNCPTTLQWKLKWFLSFCIRKYDIGWTIPVRVKSNISLKQLIWHPYNYSQNYQKSIPIILCFICNRGYMGVSLIKQPMWGNFLETHFAHFFRVLFKNSFSKMWVYKLRVWLIFDCGLHASVYCLWQYSKQM